MKLPILLAVGVLLMASPALAADGDIVRIVATKGGTTVMEHFLCDGATGGASRTCGTINLAAITIQSDGSGPVLPFPDKITFDLTTVDGSCTLAPSVEIVVLSNTDSGSVPHTVHAGLTEAGISSFTPPQGATHNLYRAVITLGDNCTDLEVIMRTHHTAGDHR